MSTKNEMKLDKEEHDIIYQALMEIKGDVGYTRGKVDALEKNNSDWWSRIIAGIACAIAFMKGV